MSIYDLKKINGYTIIKLLGEGGFGKVFLVEKNNIKYALKVFESEAGDPYEYPELENDNKYYYEKEYKILSKLKDRCDPNKTPIVCMIDNGKFHFGVTYYYLVMEYIEGYTLYEYIELCKKKNIKIDERCIIKIIYHILKGLNYLHQNEITHSDISVNNIIFNKSQLKIIDLGTASILNSNKYYTSEQLIKKDIQDLSIIITYYLYDLSTTKNKIIEDIMKYSNDIYFEKEIKNIPTAKQLMKKLEKNFHFLRI